MRKRDRPYHVNYMEKRTGMGEKTQRAFSIIIWVLIALVGIAWAIKKYIL